MEKGKLLRYKMYTVFAKVLNRLQSAVSEGNKHGEHQDARVHGVGRPLFARGGGGAGAALLAPERVRLAGRDQHAGRCQVQRLGP